MSQLNLESARCIRSFFLSLRPLRSDCSSFHSNSTKKWQDSILNVFPFQLNGISLFRYRELLNIALEAEKPCIPFLAVHTKDLLFTNDAKGNPDWVAPSVINFEKLHLIGNIVAQVIYSLLPPHRSWCEPENDSNSFDLVLQFS